MSWTALIKSLVDGGGGGGGTVTSVFTRTGEVTAQFSDYEQYYEELSQNIIVFNDLLEFQQRTAVVDNKRQLTAGHTYRFGGFNGAVDLDYPIDLNGSILDLGSPLFGLALTWFGTEPMIQGSSGSVMNGTVLCPSALCFNIIKTGAGAEYFFLENFLAFDAAGYGNIDVNDVRIDYCGSVDIDQGFTFAGVAWNTFVIGEVNLQSTNAAFVGLDIRGTLLSDARIKDVVMDAPSGSTGLMLDANSANISAGERLNYTGGKFGDDMTALGGGGTVDDIRNFFFNNGGTLEDSLTACDPKLTAPLTVPITTQFEFVDIAGVWDALEERKLGLNVNGHMSNITESPVTILINSDVVIEKDGGGSSIMAAMICLNDDPNHPRSQRTIKTVETSQQVGLGLSGIFTLQPGDFVSHKVASYSATVADINAIDAKATTLKLL